MKPVSGDAGVKGGVRATSKDVRDIESVPIVKASIRFSIVKVPGSLATKDNRMPFIMLSLLT